MPQLQSLNEDYVFINYLKLLVNTIVELICMSLVLICFSLPLMAILGGILLFL